MKAIVLFLALSACLLFAHYNYQGSWGGLGNGNGQFDEPEQIDCLAGSTLYVADCSNDRVQYFTLSGNYIGQWGSEGSGLGQFRLPEGIACSGVNRVYVSDMGNNRIQYFTSTGSYEGGWGSAGTGNGQFQSPQGVAVTTNTGNVYVCDTQNNRVQFFNPVGVYLGSFGQSILNYPVGISIAPNGYVYVTDTENDRVVYFNPSGSMLGTWGQAGTGPGQFSQPQGIKVAPVNNVVYVTDKWNHRVQYFTTSGSFLGLFQVQRPGYSAGQPVGITSVDGITLYMTDYTSNGVMFYNGTTTIEPTSLGILRSLYH